jgi:hypothetical protein
MHAKAVGIHRVGTRIRRVKTGTTAEIGTGTRTRIKAQAQQQEQE